METMNGMPLRCNYMRFRAMQNMHHLLDKDQSELDGFNAFGPGTAEGEGIGEPEGVAEEISPAAAREQLNAAAATATPGPVAKEMASKGSSGAAAVAGAAAAAMAMAKVNKKMGKSEAGQVAVAAAASAGGGKAKTAGSNAGAQRGKEEGMDKEEMRRLGLYAAFLLPLADSMCPNKKRANVSGAGMPHCQGGRAWLSAPVLVLRGETHSSASLFLCFFKFRCL